MLIAYPFPGAMVTWSMSSEVTSCFRIVSRMLAVLLAMTCYGCMFIRFCEEVCG